MFVILSKKNFKHRNHMATKTYIALQEAEQQVRFYRAIAEGYKRTLEGVEKEAEFYKNMYEREVKNRESLEKDISFDRGNYRRFRVLPRCIGQRLP